LHVGRVLCRRDVPPLSAIDPITGMSVRRRHSGIRYERRAPGELLHIDVKKLGRVPDGGGWRVHGRSEQVRGRGIGYDYLHVAIDDHTRLAYVEALPDERDTTAAAFLHRAVAWFRHHGITVLRILTDNALVYRRGTCWAAVCTALGLRRPHPRPPGLRPIPARRTRPPRRRVPAPRRGLVPPPRHHRAANPDRQRPGLPPRHLLGRGLHRPRAAPPLHQTRPPLDQRQS